MTANIGTVDRALRLVVGLTLVLAALFSGFALFDAAALKNGAIVVGAILIATAGLRLCPLYSLLGVKTCSV